MDWMQSLDNYCERTDASLLSEPLNLITNAAFIAAAIFLRAELKKVPTALRRPKSEMLVAMIFAIGVGSSLFHSIARVWSMFADVIPIAVFLISYLICFFRWQAGLRARYMTVGLAVFVLLTAITSAIANHELANGSEMYFGTWMSLFGIACFTLGQPNQKQRWLVAGAASNFSISLVLRTIDMRVCDAWPLGTHFGWHLLNGLTLFLVTKSYIMGYPAQQSSHV